MVCDYRMTKRLLLGEYYKNGFKQTIWLSSDGKDQFTITQENTQLHPHVYTETMPWSEALLFWEQIERNLLDAGWETM